MRRPPPWIDTLPRLPAAVAGWVVGAGATAGLVGAGEPWGTAVGGVLVGGGVALLVTGRPWVRERGVPEPAPVAPPIPPAPPSPRVLPDPVLDEMVELPGGEFWMGSRDDDPRAYPDEKPRHRVRVGPFRMGRTPVTVGQWNALMTADPRPGDAALPVTEVSWHDAVAFCYAASRREGRTAAYEGERWNPEADGYRLPTEAEWEYACRAGTETACSFGDDEAELGEHAWYGENSGREAHPVATRLPNRWGLHDLHGNVWEWCGDAWDAAAYGKRVSTSGDAVVDNPFCVSTGPRSERVVRTAPTGPAYRLPRPPPTPELAPHLVGEPGGVDELRVGELVPLAEEAELGPEQHQRPVGCLPGLGVGLGLVPGVEAVAPAGHRHQRGTQRQRRGVPGGGGVQLAQQGAPHLPRAELADAVGRRGRREDLGGGRAKSSPGALPSRHGPGRQREVLAAAHPAAAVLLGGELSLLDQVAHLPRRLSQQDGGFVEGDVHRRRVDNMEARVNGSQVSRPRCARRA